MAHVDTRPGDKNPGAALDSATASRGRVIGDSAAHSVTRLSKTQNQRVYKAAVTQSVRLRGQKRETGRIKVSGYLLRRAEERLLRAEDYAICEWYASRHSR
ncbi:hypothetical protein KC356_g17 [Hortaea werneckii]|nr:hypothetical protein KC356_g17 [Hortaea werneckii]